jgi:hypothetical protein
MPGGDDVYGALLEDALAGRRAAEIVERDDGFVMAFDPEHLKGVDSSVRCESALAVHAKREPTHSGRRRRLRCRRFLALFVG